MKAKRQYTQPVTAKRSGFTLVEMLVVIAIIGILTAILVPVIGGAIRTSHEFAIKADMKNIETAIENYKAKTFAYPTDFRNPATLRPHVSKLNGRAITNALIDTSNFANTATWYGSTLNNPHYTRGLSPIQTRRPNTIDAAESWVFWLYETTNNPTYPLGAIPFNNTFVLDPNWLTVWDPNRFMAFDEKRFTDIDQDGWFEYVAPEGADDVPYVYFDCRTYANAATFFNAVYATPANAPRPFGEVRPYLQQDDHNNVNGPNFKWYEPNKYQLLNCGLDGEFGDYAYAGFNVNNPNTYKIIPHNENISVKDRDNIFSATAGRVDKSFED